VFNNADSAFDKKWHGQAVNQNNWVLGDKGNQHIFDSTTATKIPAGEYILGIFP